MYMTRRRVIQSLGLMSYLASAGLRSAAAQTLQKVTVRLDWVAGADHAPLFVALARGYYKDEGLDVEIRDGTGSNATIQAVASGNDTIGLASYAQVILAASKGVDNLIGIADIVQKAPDSIVALKGSGIIKPSDLNGKRWGFVPTDSGARIFPAFAAANGVDIGSLKKLQLSHATIFTALLNGDADFICAWASPDAFKIAKQKPIEPPMVFADYGVNTLGTGIIVRRELVEKQADVVRKFMKATAKGATEVDANFDGAVNAIAQARPASDKESIVEELRHLPEYLHTEASRNHPYGWVADADVKQTLSLIAKYFEMQNPVDGSKLFTNDFIPA